MPGRAVTHMSQQGEEGEAGGQREDGDAVEGGG